MSALRRQRSIMLSLPFFLFVSLSGCSTVCGEKNSEECMGMVGGGAGAAVGSVLGRAGNATTSAFAGAGGAFAGFFLGKQLGRYLDEREKEQAQEAAFQALESATGEASWQSEDGEASGTARTVSGASTDCQFIEHTVVKDGKEFKDKVEFCKDPETGRMTPKNV